MAKIKEAEHSDENKSAIESGPTVPSTVVGQKQELQPQFFCGRLLISRIVPSQDCVFK